MSHGRLLPGSRELPFPGREGPQEPRFSAVSQPEGLLGDMLPPDKASQKGSNPSAVMANYTRSRMSIRGSEQNKLLIPCTAKRGPS